MNEAWSSTLLDVNGSRISFESVLNSQTVNVQRTLVVFIRHFFCGNCQEYVRRIAKDLNPSTLPDDLSIVVVGCGAASLIPSYRQTTQCPFPLYTDPTTEIHRNLGMRRSLSLGSKDPAYIQHSLATGVMKSVLQGLRRIPSGDAGKAGDLSVNGGEFLFVRDEAAEDWNLAWSHCMKNSRDHTEIDVLRSRLGLEKSTSPVKHLPIDHASCNITSTHIPACSANSNCPHSAYQDAPLKYPENIKRSVSTKRRSWTVKTGLLTRSPSFKGCIIRVS